jgi:hypothetical protein
MGNTLSCDMNHDIAANKGDAELIPLWSAKVAAEYLEMAEAKFRYYVFTRRIPYYRIGGVFRGGVIRFNQDDVRQWRQLPGWYSEKHRFTAWG